MSGSAADRVERRGGAPERVGDVLPRVLASAGVGKRSPRTSTIVALWERAAGTELSSETRPDRLQRGVLTVEVRSAALLAELTNFRTQELLERLVSADGTGRITGLRFRPGVF